MTKTIFQLYQQISNYNNVYIMEILVFDFNDA